MYEKVIGKLKLIRDKFAEILCKSFVVISFVGLTYSLTMFALMTILLDFYWVNEATVIFLTSMVMYLLSKKMGY